MFHSAPVARERRQRDGVGRLGAGSVLSRAMRQHWPGLGSSLKQQGDKASALCSPCAEEGGVRSSFARGGGGGRLQPAQSSELLGIFCPLHCSWLGLPGVILATAMTWLPLRGVGSAAASKELKDCSEPLFIL